MSGHVIHTLLSQTSITVGPLLESGELTQSNPDNCIGQQARQTAFEVS